MKFVFILFLLALNLHAQWVYNIGGSSDDTGYSITVDALDNIYLTGRFYGSNVDFNPNEGTDYLNSNGDNDIFFSKYNSDGEYQWAYNIGSSGTDIGNKIYFDDSGNIYLIGNFTNSDVDFDPGAGTALLSSNGDYDIFFAKYNSDGEYQWAYNIGGTGRDYGNGICTDPSGNVYITGAFLGSNVDFDPGVGIANLSSNGSTDIFLAKYSSDGEYQWAYNFGGSIGDSGNKVTVDNSNNVYITGTISSNLFFAKYNSNGENQWQNSIASASGIDIIVDGSGYFYITGSFNGTNIDFDPGVGTANLTTNGSGDIYVAKYNLNCEYQWAFNIGGSSTDYSTSIDVDGTGNVYITGSFYQYDVDFDPGPGTSLLICNGNYDIFIAKYNLNGEYQWAYNYGESSTDQGQAIKVSENGSVYITGNFFSSNIDFDPGPGTTYLTTNGGWDIYFGKYFATDGALPVELSFFKAIEGNGQITLQWRTESENDNVAFFIERSENDKDFIRIAQLDGQGSTSISTDYEYVDMDVVNGVTYYYRLADMDYSGQITYHNNIAATPQANTPVHFALYQNTPNPFNPSTLITYDVPQVSDAEIKVNISVYNILGQKVIELFNGAVDAGTHTASWNGKDQNGNSVPAGVYIYRISADKFNQAKKMMYLK